MTAKLDRTDTQAIYMKTLEKISDLRHMKHFWIMSDSTRIMIDKGIEKLQDKKVYIETKNCIKTS